MGRNRNLQIRTFYERKIRFQFIAGVTGKIAELENCKIALKHAVYKVFHKVIRWLKITKMLGQFYFVRCRMFIHNYLINYY